MYKNIFSLLQESLNATVDDKKKVQIDENELGSNILADRRNKLETAAQVNIIIIYVLRYNHKILTTIILEQVGIKTAYS